MLQINQITDDTLQKQNLVLPDGTIIQLTIYYVPLQYGWFIQELIYGSFVINGMRITNSPNMLRQFKNQIPFGLACFTTAQREPTQQEDFASLASILYILTEAEVQQYEEFLQSG